MGIVEEEEPSAAIQDHPSRVRATFDEIDFEYRDGSRKSMAMAKAVPPDANISLLVNIARRIIRLQMRNMISDQQQAKVRQGNQPGLMPTSSTDASSQSQQLHA